MSAEIAKMASWYRSSAREYFQELVPERLPFLDADLASIEAVAARSELQLPICFLGSSGVGKSTLINAVVAGAHIVLPAGGVGPLTAQATIVRYSSERFFKVEYQTAQRLHNVWFGVRQAHHAELKKLGREVPALDHAEPLPVDGLPVAGIEELPTEEEAGARTPRIEAFIQQLALLVRGDQFAETPDLGYLLDAVQFILGRAQKYGATFSDADKARIERARTVLSHSETDTNTYERHAASDAPGFFRDLKEHAAGFLAPLIRRIEVGWDSGVLKNGVVLVDLPGVGVANDEYREVTASYIRQAHGVVLVVDRAGVTDAAADLLRTTGFLSSLLHHDTDDSVEQPQLLIAAVKLDQSADEARSEEKQQGGALRPWATHFSEIADRAKVAFRDQLSRELNKIVAESSATTREARQETVSRVLESLEVHPIAALEYRKILAADDDEPARLKDVDSTLVPGLQDALTQIALRRGATMSARLEEKTSDWLARISTTLALEIARWNGDERVAAEGERIRNELEEFAEPLRKELENRHGSFRNYLKETVPAVIDGRVTQASADALEDIRKYLRKISGYHWSTLRAAVKHNGVFEGAKNVNIPNEITLKFEDPVAIVWSQHILRDLRKKTAAMGEDYVRLVGQIVDWAHAQGTRINPKLLDPLHEDLKQSTKGLGTIGKEAIDELKEKVKAELFTRVEARVRKACIKFVDDKKHIGEGVKLRIHELLDSLAEEVVKEAKPAAISVLTKNYGVVELEIRDAFKTVENPVDKAVSTIVESHESYVKRSDARKRGRVLEQGAALQKSLKPFMKAWAASAPATPSNS